MRLFEGTKWDRPPRSEQGGELEEDCTCPPPPRVLTPPQKQTARLAVEKRKKGKVVTVVRGLPADENDLPSLLSQLKAACGAGGTVKDDLLETRGITLSAFVACLRILDTLYAAEVFDTSSDHRIGWRSYDTSSVLGIICESQGHLKDVHRRFSRQP